MLSNLVQNHLDFIVFSCALLAERFFPLVTWYHPNTALIAIFSAIGKRTYRADETKSYHYLATILACSVIVSVLLIIVVLLLELAFYPELLAGLILYLCLESKALDKKALRIAKLLKQNQKSAARELLKPLVAREVTKLSAAGILKAVIESLILRTARYYFVVIFIFLVFGPIAALGYRLLTLIHSAWRNNVKPNSVFLGPLRVSLFIIEFIPMRLLALTIAASKASKQSLHYIKHYGRHYYQTNSGWLLSCCAASLGVQLGGPAVYFAERFNKMRIGSDRLPVAEDIAVIINRLNQARGFWFLVILGIEILTSI
ncbi:cobalamin biosynthesis protein [Pseudoalteromonas sp.]|uniref:cobalamin biosynthesis protein CobD/CbiB n=1 Tax=Pseudoalteromonas sp. TaxID=53249 RepID=UPI0035626909